MAIRIICIQVIHCCLWFKDMDGFPEILPVIPHSAVEQKRVRMGLNGSI